MTDDENADKWIRDTFQDRVADVDGVTIENVTEWYKDKLAEYGDEKMARIAVQSDFNSWVNAGADGEVEIITIGYQDDPFNNGEVFIGYGVCMPDNKPTKLGSVMFRENDVNPDEFRHFFAEPFNHVIGEFDFATHDSPVGSDAYNVEAVEKTQMEYVDDGFDREKCKEMVEERVPTAEIASISESLSLTNSDQWAAGFGVDMKCVDSAYVHSARVGESAARLVIQDDTFVDARDLGQEIRGEDGDEGLVAYADPALVGFGEGSFVDLYGPIVPSQDGQVIMNVFGVEEIRVKNEQDNSSSSSASSEDNVGGGAGASEERTI